MRNLELSLLTRASRNLSYALLVFLSTSHSTIALAKRKPVKKETLVGNWDIPSVDGSPKATASFADDKSYSFVIEQQDGTKRTVKGKYHLSKPYTIFLKDTEGFGANCRGEGSYDYAQKGDQVFFTLRNDRCMDRIKMFKTTWKRPMEGATAG